MTTINVNKDNFKREVLESGKTVLIDFWASWCGPCRMVSPIIDEIAEERNDIKVCKVNVDETGRACQRFWNNEHSYACSNERWKNSSAGARCKT